MLTIVLYNIQMIAGSISDAQNPPKASLPAADMSGRSTEPPKKLLVFTKKENATLAQCIELLDWHKENGRNQSKTAHQFVRLS